MYSITNPIDFLTLLRTNVFYGCNLLEIFSIESPKKDAIVLSDNITSLGEGVFQGCTNIVDAYIDISYNTIPKDLFNGCINLKQVYFIEPSNITTIGTSSFQNTAINDITMPTTLTTIEANAFNSCLYLEKIIFFDLVTAIASTSFANCEKLTIANQAIIVNSNNNTVVSTYFGSSTFDVSIIDYNNFDTFLKFFYDASVLLETTYDETKDYFYPYIDIKIQTNKTLLPAIPLINNNISNPSKQKLFKQLIINFIFETNKQYNSFITTNTNIILQPPTITTSSYNVVVYNSQVNGINVFNDIDSNKLGIYALLNNFTSEFLINNYKLKLNILNNVTEEYQFNYSSDNFINSTTLTKDINQTVDITNFSIYTGEYNDVFIYRNELISTTPLSCYLNGLSLNITSSKSEVLIGEVTQTMTADATASLNIPLSVVINTFMYWTDAINVDEVIPDGVKFKVVNNLEWQNIYLARAITSSSNGGIPYYKPSSIMAKNEIKYDFVRYIALKLFKTSAGADIFRNNDQVTSSIENNAQTALLNKLSELENLGEFTNEDSINNVSRIIFRQIVQQQPSRIIPNEGTWTPMNLYAGDKLYLKLTINTDSNQHKLLNPNNTTPIPSRSYLIELNLISG